MRKTRIRLSPSLTPAIYARRPRAPLPFPLDDARCSLFARARDALWRGVASVGLEPGDEVLAPAYHCGTEIEALARAGLIPRFYEATDTLEPDRDELDALVTPRTRAFLLIHYFGFPQDVRGWRTWCDERRLLLIEDCAQAWLASRDGIPVGSLSDLAVFSLYKSIPIPDGAALVAEWRRPPSASRRRLGVVSVAKKHARWVMARSAVVDCALAGGERLHAQSFELGDVDDLPSASTLFLLPRLADSSIAARRRRNYAALLDAFGERTPAPFGTLPEGASPLVFPVETRRGSDLLERLERTGVEAPFFWPILHPLLPAEKFPQAVRWHERFVALPVHQELRDHDVDRIRAALAGPRPLRRAPGERADATPGGEAAGGRTPIDARRREL